LKKFTDIDYEKFGMLERDDIEKMTTNFVASLSTNFEEVLQQNKFSLAKEEVCRLNLKFKKFTGISGK